MLSYYFAMVFITISTLATSLVQLIENQTLPRSVRAKLMIIAALIMTGTICEFLGLELNDMPSSSRLIHGVVKAMEFSIAPIIPIVFARIVGHQDLGKKIDILTKILLISNIVFEFGSIFTKSVFYIDENNIYKHGEYYGIYTIMYFAGIAILIVEMIKYTKRYQIRNIPTLVSMLIFAITGFSIRLIDSSIYSDWLVVAISYLLFIIFYTDLSLKIDVLTELLNRKSYWNRLRKLDYPTVIILLDANEFKQVNDEYGHQTGDTVLKVLAKAILEIYGEYGYCYRIGGDEFCVILKSGVLEEFSKEMNSIIIEQKINELNKKFDELIETKKEQYPMLKYGVAKGYAIFSGVLDAESRIRGDYSMNAVNETVKIADEKMYENKKMCKEGQ